VGKRGRRSGTRIAIALGVVAILSVATGSVAASNTVGPSGAAPSGGNSTLSPSVDNSAGTAAPLTQVTSLNVGSGPKFILQDPANGYLYVPNGGSDNVSVFKGNTATNVAAGTTPLFPVYNPLNGFVYVTNGGGSTVTVINGTSSQASILTGLHPWFAAFDPINGYVYVPNMGTDTVTILSGTSVYTTVKVGQSPRSAVFDPLDNCMLVPNFNSSNVSSICPGSDGSFVIGHVTVGSSPNTATFDSSDGYVYVMNTGSTYVTVLNGTTLASVTTVQVAAYPQGGTFDPWDGFVYTSGGAGGVSVINGTKVVGSSISVGGNLRFGTFNPSTNEVYIPNSLSTSVAVFNGSTFVRNVSVGTDPYSVSYDPGDEDAFSANSGASTVSVIPGGAGSSGDIAPCTSVTNLTVQVQSGYRQAWVNWTNAAGSTGEVSLVWWIASGTGAAPLTAPEPTFTDSGRKVSYNLNALRSGTDYQLDAQDSTSCAYATTTGTFATSGAPSGEFVGWVSNQALSPDTLDPIGTPIEGATVGIAATCYALLGDSKGTVFFEGAQTNVTGAYTVTFPLENDSPSDGEWVLGSNGTCVTYYQYLHGVETEVDYTTNSQYTLVATHKGQWNITRNVSSTLSPQEDYQEFALPPNDVVNEPVSLALIHTTYDNVDYNDAECGTSFYQNSSSSKVTLSFESLSTQFFGLSGSSNTSETNTSGSSWSTPGVWGADTGLELGYTFSGFDSDNDQTTPENMYPVSNVRDVQYGPYTTTDWLSSPPAYNGTLAPGYVSVAVSPEYNSSSNATPAHTVFTSGSFTQATEITASITAPFQWAGVDWNLSYKLGYSTSISSSLAWTEGCNFFNPVKQSPNPTLYALFYYLNDDTGKASTVVHVWFMGWCATQTDEGAPVCPGD
jgi:YVTN family beta-propeller protein